jgi:hypothetical protein
MDGMQAAKVHILAHETLQLFAQQTQSRKIGLASQTKIDFVLEVHIHSY